MAVNAPGPLDYNELQFKLHEKLSLFSAGKLRNVDLLAAASNYGLIFAGNPNNAEIKVLLLKNLVEAKETGSQIPFRTFTIPNVPNCIAISSDHSLLAVNYTQNGSAFLAIYNVQSFLSANIILRSTIRIFPEDNVEAKQILWNPVLSTTFAIVLNNGAMGMYTLKEPGEGGGYEYHSIDKTEEVKCACWSPKGKQIVVGFPNGNLVQYKPDLKIAKKIACPPNIHEGPFDTIAVQWLSTFQFAAVFLQRGEDMYPALYIVNAPKAGNLTYINYSDISFSSSGPRNAQIFLIHIQPWNLLLMTSANSVEVGLVGTVESGETPLWRQYMPSDDSRIELPLNAECQETYPIGFSFDTGTTHQLTINDNKIPAMPMLHLLSTDGILVSFDFLNLTPNAPSVTCPPQNVIDKSGMDFFIVSGEKFSATGTSQQPQAVQPSAPVLGSPFSINLPASTEISFSIPSSSTSTPATVHTVNKTKPFFGPSEPASNMFGGFSVSSAKSGESATTTSPAFSTPSIFAPPMNTTTTSSIGFTGPGFGLKQNTEASIRAPTSILGTHQIIVTTEANTKSLPFSAPKPTGIGFPSGNTQNTFGNKIIPFGESQIANQPLQPQQKQIESADKSKPLFTIPPTFCAQQQQQIMVEDKNEPKAGSVDELNAELHDIFIRNLISTEIESFDKELKELFNTSKNINTSIGNIEESKNCVKKLNSLQELSDQAVESTESLAADIQSLRNTLNEALIMIADVKSKIHISKNPELSYLTTVSTVSQTNRRQLTKLKSLIATNDDQLRIVNQQLDAQWSNYQDLVRKNNGLHVPKLEGIYQTMIKHTDILAKHRIKLNNIKSKLGIRGILEQSVAVKSNVKIDSLTDSILSMSLCDQVKEDTSKLNGEKLQALRDVLQNRKILKIKPQRPDRKGLSSEVISQQPRTKAVLAKARENAVLKPQKMEAQRIRSEQIQIAKPTATKPKIGQQISDIQQNKAPTQIIQNNVPISVKPMQITQTNNKSPNMFPSFGGQSFGIDPSKNKGISSEPIGFNFTKKAVESTKPDTTSSVIADENSKVEFKGTLFNPDSSLIKNYGGTAKLAEKIAEMNSAIPEFSTNSNQKVDNNQKSKDVTYVGAPEHPIYITNPQGHVTVYKDPAHVEKSAAQKPTIPSGFFAKPADTTTALPKDLTKEQDTLNKISENTNDKNNTSQPSSTPVTSSTPFTSFNFNISTSNENKTNTSIFSNALSLMAKQSENNANTVVVPAATTNPSIGDSTVKDSFTFAISSNPSSDSKSAFSFGGTTSVSTPAFGGFSLSSTAATTPSSFSFASLTTTAAGTTVTTSAETTVFTSPTSTSPIAAASSGTVAKETPDSIFANLNICKPTAPESSTGVTTQNSTQSMFSGSSIFSTSSFAATASPDNKSIFGGSSSTPSSIFSTTPTTTSGAPAFSTAQTASSNVFAGIPKPDQSVFGNISSPTTPPAPSSPFAPQPNVAISSNSSTTPSTSPFGVQAASTIASAQTNTTLPFGVQPTSSVAPATSTVSPFSIQATSSGITTASTTPPFGVQTQPFSVITQPQSSSGNIFGSSAVASPTGFGIQQSGTGTVSIFGGAAVPSQPATTTFSGTGSVFGLQKSDTSTNIFGSPTQSNVTAGGGGSLFGSAFGNNTSQPNSSIFGGNQATAGQTPAFGSSVFGQTTQNTGFDGGMQQQPSIFGGNTGGFGQQPFGQQQQPSAFGQTGGFGSTSPGGSFAQGGPSIAQTGFGSPVNSGQQQAFAKPAFGSASPTFGSPPAFGGGPTFGGAPTFGSPKSPFSSFQTQSAIPVAGNTGGAFSSPSQKNNIFESLGSSDTGLSFGNLAQNANANNSKPQFGGSSFSSWR